MEDNYTLTFNTENQDYKIILSCKRSLFLSKDRFYVNITFMNNIDNIITSFNISDIELYNIIDNIETYINYEESIMYTISIEDYSFKSYTIELSTQYNDDLNNITNINNLEYKTIFNLYSYQYDSITKILSFDITNSLQYFLNTLYKIINHYTINSKM